MIVHKFHKTLWRISEVGEEEDGAINDKQSCLTTFKLKDDLGVLG